MITKELFVGILARYKNGGEMGGRISKNKSITEELEIYDKFS